MILTKHTWAESVIKEALMNIARKLSLRTVCCEFNLAASSRDAVLAPTRPVFPQPTSFSGPSAGFERIPLGTRLRPPPLVPIPFPSFLIPRSPPFPKRGSLQPPPQAFQVAPLLLIFQSSSSKKVTRCSRTVWKRAVLRLLFTASM